MHYTFPGFAQLGSTTSKDYSRKRERTRGDGLTESDSICVEVPSTSEEATTMPVTAKTTHYFVTKHEDPFFVCEIDATPQQRWRPRF
mmetsp:Transcript_10742/g.28421  ORF Transcript_10742/g.28421 Transcript_10742/m.28421 type:complete len:87 (+) Transcript_10742:887-1147(+)